MLLLLLAPTVQAAAVDRAAVVHVSPLGLAHLGAAVADLLPASIPVTDLGGTYACDEADATPLTWSMDDLELLVGVEDVLLAPHDGQLDLTVAATLATGASSLQVQGDCAILTDLDETCAVRLETASLVVGTSLSFTSTGDGVQVQAAPLAVDLSPVANPLGGCLLSDALATLLAQDPEALSALVLDLLAPSLEGLEADLAAAVQDALDAMVLDTSVALGDAALDLSVRPTEVVADEGGLQVRLAVDLGGTDEPSPCADAEAWPWEPPGADWPVLVDSTAPGSTLTYDGGLLLSRELVDRLLWEVWAAGGLCLDLGELSGLDLTSDFLAPFLDPAFGELFVEPSPLALRLAPGPPPAAVLSADTPPLAIAVDDLGLELVGALDERSVRLFRVGLAAQVGVDPGVTAEEIVPAILLDPIDLAMTETYNPFLPVGFSGGLEDLVATLLPSFLPELGATPLATAAGIGLGDVFYVPTDDDAWLGAYALLDTSAVEPVEVTGCSGASLGCSAEGGDTGAELDLDTLLGCSDAGCSAEGCASDGCADAGCSAGGPVLPGLGRAFTALALALLALLRRRPPRGR